MPTGYTADLHDGEQSFEDFVWKCARGMGAFITMRDEPLDAPVPTRFEPSSWHQRELERARHKLADAKSWTPQEAQQRADAAYREVHEKWVESEQRRAAMRERYEAMLAQVEAWQPPSPNHIGFKQFMVQQLNESIRFDCGSAWQEPEPDTADGYRQAVIEKAQRDIEYHEREYAAEVERAAERTLWVQALRDSVGDPPQRGDTEGQP